MRSISVARTRSRSSALCWTWLWPRRPSCSWPCLRAWLSPAVVVIPGKDCTPKALGHAALNGAAKGTASVAIRSLLRKSQSQHVPDGRIFCLIVSMYPIRVLTDAFSSPPSVELSHKLFQMNSTLFPPPSASGTSTEIIVAHCDGGSRGNPGPAGYGAVIEDSNGRILARLSEYLGKRTNNYAEYSGLLAVLAWAIEHRHSRLRVVSDSELMVKQMQGKYKVNSPDLRPLWEEAGRRANQLAKFEI